MSVNVEIKCGERVLCFDRQGGAGFPMATMFTEFVVSLKYGIDVYVSHTLGYSGCSSRSCGSLRLDPTLSSMSLIVCATRPAFRPGHDTEPPSKTRYYSTTPLPAVRN